MENKKGTNFGLGIILVILGMTLFKHFDFQNLKFNQPVLDAIYGIAFLMGIYLLVRGNKGEAEK